LERDCLHESGSKKVRKVVIVKSEGVKQPTTHIAVMEDDPLRLVGLHSMLDSVSTFRVTAMSVSTIAADPSVDLVLILNYSPLKLAGTMAELKAFRPTIRVIATGLGADDEAILKALTAGAKGYVDEAVSKSELVQAIYAVHAGMAWASRRVISMLVERSSDPAWQKTLPDGSALTNREKEVLAMLVGGCSNKDIANPLGIEERTVKAHVSKLMRKLGAKNRISLAIHAVTHALVCP
jgi:DNA-binding NarL/FixJ family response regulator